MKTQVRLLTILLLFTSAAIAQEKWTLVDSQDGIKVYHSTSGKSGFKKIRVECTTEGTTDKMLAILKDVPRYSNWVYSNRHAAILKHVNSNEFYYYTITDMPWPVIDRDAAVHAKVTYEGASLVVTEVADPNYLPRKQGLVRVPQSFIKWTVTPVGANQVKIAYHFEADPGGSLPPFVVNAFADKGPLESFKKLQVLLKK